MKRGRLPIPTATKERLGLRIRKPAAGSELRLPVEVPPMPAWLTKEAKKEWDRVTPELVRLGLIAAIDLAALVTYCTAVGELEIATRVLAKEGRVCVWEIFDKQGKKVGERLKAHPVVQMQRDAARLVKQFVGEFGLTPANRSRVTTAATSDAGDERENKFFGGFRPQA